jgi:hypothetical protein
MGVYTCIRTLFLNAINVLIIKKVSLQIPLRETLLNSNTSVSIETTFSDEEHVVEGKFLFEE